MLGTERVGHYEHVIVEGVKSVMRIPFPSLFKASEALEDAAAENLGHDDTQAIEKNGGAEACTDPVNLWSF